MLNYIKQIASLYYLALFIGLFSIICQLVVLNEFFFLYSSNELIAGIVFSLWMLFSAFGAYVGKFVVSYAKCRLYILYLSLLLPVVAVLLFLFIPEIKNLVVKPGLIANPLNIISSCFIIILPFCLLTGMLFTLMSVYSRKIVNIRKIYAYDVIGAILGSLIFYVLLVLSVQPLYIIISASILLLVILVLFLEQLNIQKLFFRLYIVFVLFFIILFPNFYKPYYNNSFLKNQTVIELINSPYSKYLITENNEQFNLFSNGEFVISSDSKNIFEEISHLALLQRKNISNVLVINAHFLPVFKEIEKHNPSKIVSIEYDKSLIYLSEKYFGKYSDHRLAVVNSDPIAWIKKCESVFDIIIVNSGLPSTIGNNRYYTKEFFKELKSISNDSTVVLTSMLAATNYFGSNENELLSLINNTIKQSFKNVQFIPLSRNWILASNNSLSLKIGHLSQESKVVADYINPWYYDDYMMEVRVEALFSQLSNVNRVNSLLKPLAYYHYINHWLSLFKSNYLFVFLSALFFLVLTILVIKGGKVNIALFTAGFGSSAIQILIIVLYQSFIGYAYLMISVIISIFMLGLAIGSLVLPVISFGKKSRVKASNSSLTSLVQEHEKSENTQPSDINSICRVSKQTLIRTKEHNNIIALLLFGISILSVLLIVSVNYFDLFPQVVKSIVLFLFVFVLAIISGYIFALSPLMLKNNIGNRAAIVYTSDMIGAALGYLVMATVLIPLLGIINSCWLVAFFALIAAFINFTFVKRI